MQYDDLSNSNSEVQDENEARKVDHHHQDSICELVDINKTYIDQ